MRMRMRINLNIFVSFMGNCPYIYIDGKPTRPDIPKKKTDIVARWRNRILKKKERRFVEASRGD